MKQKTKQKIDINKVNFRKELIKLFANKTGCSIQYGKCPCNSCFHSIDADFNHICWLIVLGLRGDYDKQEIINSIREGLNKK